LRLAYAAFSNGGVPFPATIAPNADVIGQGELMGMIAVLELLSLFRDKSQRETAPLELFIRWLKSAYPSLISALLSPSEPYRKHGQTVFFPLVGVGAARLALKIVSDPYNIPGTVTAATRGVARVALRTCDGERFGHPSHIGTESIENYAEGAAEWVTLPPTTPDETVLNGAPLTHTLPDLVFTNPNL